MATPAHCAYCFESLSASLEKRRPLTLAQVEESWATWEDTDEDEPEEADQSTEDVASAARTDSSAKPAAISRLLAPSTSSSSSSSLPSTSSSNAPTEASSATSKSSSSRSSLFSIGRRLRGYKQEAAETQEYPLFVTWNTISKSGNKSLRGCIGTFEAQELEDGLRSYALTSAFDDTRFSPITLHELPSLEAGITLLTDFEPAPSPISWDIGTHGLRISFSWHGRRYGATYLPDVAKEQGWTKEETLVSLMRKAGWNGSSKEWKKVADLNVVRYQGMKCAMGYAEWREWRDWLEEQDGVGGERTLN